MLSTLLSFLLSALSQLITIKTGADCDREQARQSNTIKQIKLIGFNFGKFKNKSRKENVKTKFLFLKT